MTMYWAGGVGVYKTRIHNSLYTVIMLEQDLI